MVKTEELQMHVRESLLKKMIWNKAPALKIHPRSREGRQKQLPAVEVFFASLKLGEDLNFIVDYLECHTGRCGISGMTKQKSPPSFDKLRNQRTF